ncbi:SusC/RagA family TonB-linked outer membrane protein [Bacteroidales bacterium]|nr:SusC/RagA family TonB-linked outer membrane protein [Bacteroidales bacterium]
MKRMTLFLLCFFVSIGLAIGQNARITGVVIDENGETVIGASIVVKGTQVGTVTDIDGKFSIDADGKILVISSIGMVRQEIKATPNMRVALSEDTRLLDEVIVVAFGTAKKSAFTGSAATIKSEDITKRQTSNVTNALAGQVAGVQITNSNGQPGSGSNIRIRGIGSMAASNTPLFVVDGTPFDGDISSINSQDIESMTILKDAASNALYGARGANGVVIITTKRGTSKEAIINFDAKWGRNSKAVSNYDVINSPSTYYEKVYEAIYNSKYDGNNAAEANKYSNDNMFTNSNGGAGYQVYSFPQGESFIGMNGKMNPNASLGYKDAQYYYTPDNWEDELFNSDNLRQEYNVNISGRSDKINYYMSAGYLEDSGIIPGSGFERYSSRLKADYQAKKWLTIGGNISYTNYDSNYPANQTLNSSSANLFYVTNMMAPIYPLYVRNVDGNIKKDKLGYTVYDFGDKTSTNFKRQFMSGSNPASVLELDRRNYLADVFSSKWNANFDIYEGLKATINIGFNAENTRYKRLYNAYYGQYAATGGIAYAGANRTSSINKQYLASYNKTILDKHNFDILAGYEGYDYKYQYLRGSKEKLFNPDIDEIDNAIINPSISSKTDTYATEGYLSRIQYDYDSKYFASASYRRDASSRFEKDSRWGNFWSLGGAWILNKEDFLSDIAWIETLKYKISYGVQGNDALLYSDNSTINYYPSQDQYEISESNGEFASNLSYKGNKDITWETSHSFNTGFEYALFKGKVAGSIEYFSRKTTDMLYYLPVSPSLGYSKMPMNIGSMINKGLEFDINAEIYQNKNFAWNLNFNATHFKNKILELEESLKGELIDGSRIYQEGESMYQMYLRRYAGVNAETGQSLWFKDETDVDGNITEVITTDSWADATRYGSGDILPSVYGGFGTSIKFFSFDCSAAFAYQIGGKIYDNTYSVLMHQGDSQSAGINWHKDILNSWSTENKNSDIPRVNASDKNTNYSSDRFLISSDYLSLQNITFGYTLPKKFAQKIDLSSLRAYVVGDNLGLFAKRTGLDPRQSYTTTGSYSYSPMRSISVGVSVSF